MIFTEIKTNEKIINTIKESFKEIFNEYTGSPLNDHLIESVQERLRNVIKSTHPTKEANFFFKADELSNRLYLCPRDNFTLYLFNKELLTYNEIDDSVYCEDDDCFYQCNSNGNITKIPTQKGE